MSDLPALDSSTLVYNDAPSLIWIRVRDAVRYLWIDNPKRHDIPKIKTSIRTYGFQDLPKFDKNLTPVTTGLSGGIKSGNGRIEVLDLMEKEGQPLPRGLAQEADNGPWAMPLVIGTDAASRALARAYAVDANNLTMTGLTAEQQSQVWSAEGYLSLLEQAKADDTLPISISAEEADALLASLNPDPDSNGDDPDDPGEPELAISPELLERHDYVVIYADNQLDWNVLSELLQLEKVYTAPVHGKTIKQKGLGRVIPASKLFAILKVSPETGEPYAPSS